MRNLITFLIVGLVVSVCLNIYQCMNEREEIERTDTLYNVRVDTVTDSLPPVINERLVRHITVRVESIGNSVNVPVRDSVVLPVTQKIYHKDSSYTAWVSGYEPCLDSIRVYNRTETFTITKTVKPSRWNIGVTGGYGIGLKHGRMEPFVGIGVSYRIWGR